MGSPPGPGSKFVKKPVVRADVPFANSLADRYTIVVSANNYLQSGFTPVRVKPGVLSIVDLMLLPKENAFNFGEAAWEKLQQNHSKLFGILAHGS